MIRTWKNGDTMVPQSFTITVDVQTDWSNPKVSVCHAVVDSTGEIYHPQSLLNDYFRFSELVEKGIWTDDESQIMKDLYIKAYIGFGVTPL